MAQPHVITHSYAWIDAVELKCMGASWRAANYCLRSRNYINVIAAEKQPEWHVPAVRSARIPSITNAGS